MGAFGDTVVNDGVNVLDASLCDERRSVGVGAV